MRSSIRNWWALGLGVLAFGLAAWYTPGLWRKLDGWIQNQRDSVWERLETAVGQKIVYDRITPNVLAALDFQNVRILAEDGTPVLTASSIRFSWDWSFVFQGRLAEALRKVRFINASLNLDAQRDAVLIRRWADLLEASNLNGVAATGFQVDAFNFQLRWTDKTRFLMVDRGFLTLNPKGNEWGLRFRGFMSGEDHSSGRLFAAMTVRGDLRSDASFQNLSLRAETSQVTTSWFDLEPVTLQITVDPQRVIIAKVADQTPLDVQAIWVRSTNLWEFKGEAEGFRPSRLIHWKGNQATKGMTEGTFSGRFTYQIGGDSSFEGRAIWPSGVLPAPFGSEGLEATGAMRTEKTLLRFSDLHLDSPSFVLDFEGSFDPKSWLPEGTLRLDRWSFPGAGEARGILQFVRSQNRIDFTGDEIGWNSLGITRPQGWVMRTDRGWRFQIDGLLRGVSQGALSAGGSLQAQGLQWDVSAKVASLSVGILRDEIHWHDPQFVFPKVLLPLDLDFSLHLNGKASEILVADSSFEFLQPDRPEHQISGTLAWKENHLNVVLSTFQWEALTASATLGADFINDGPVDWTLNGKLWDHGFALTGRWDPFSRTVVFSGSPGVEGELHQNQTGAWGARFSMLPYEVNPGWLFGFRAQGILDEDDWSLDADQVTLSGHYPWNQEPFAIQAKLSADSRRIGVKELFISDAQGTLGGTLGSSWSQNFVQPWVGNFSVTTPTSGRESLMVSWVGTASDHWHFVVRASGLDVTRAGLPGVQGRLSLSGAGDWIGPDRTWSAQVALSEAQYGDSPLGFRATLSGTSHHASIRNLNLSVNPIRITDGSLDWDAETRGWQASLGFGLRLGANDWESQWTAQGAGSQPGKPWRTDFRVKTHGNTWAKRVFPDWAIGGYWGELGWDISLEDGRLAGHGSPDGSFQILAGAPFPIQGDARGLWKKGALELSVKGFRADLGLVKEFVNSKLFAVTGGEVLGDFTLGGAFSDPDVTGRLLLKGLAIESSFVRHAVGPVDVPVVFEGHTVRIEPVNFGPAGQSWFVSGLARLDHLLPEEYEFSVETDALSEIPASYQYSGISSTGNVNGVFVVKGNTREVTLGGRLILEDTTITLKDSSSSADSNALDFNADLTLITGRKVEFLWPNQTLPLIQAVTAPGQTMLVRANQVESTWSLDGKLALKTGQINYLNRTFLLKQGQLIFQENQAKFDPQISLRAEWRVQEDSGPLIIILRADGSLAKFSPRFESSPYLSPAVLQQLVGTTLVLPSDYTNTTSMDTALSLASDVGTSFLLTPLEEAVKRNLNLDLFTVRTELLKRSLLNRNDTLNAVDYLDNTRLFFGKYIGDDLFLQGSLAFYQGVIDATQVSQVVDVDPEVEMDLQTPFFGLNWTLLFQHLTTYFVGDNTVTLRWNWSY